jgi:hypothetical protein
MKNNIRFDLSDYLIHFFRDVDLVGGNAIVFPEHMGWQNLWEDTFLPANFLLRAALRNGRLWATWSFRNSVRTIYGPNPAICFTEMPIAAFLEAGHARWAEGQAMSPFALVFPKAALHRLGARPVMYGLSDEYIPPSGAGGGQRLLPESVLPLQEQYRYVSHNPNAKRNIDWTHEREWRWPYRGDISKFEAELEGYGQVSNWDDIPGLDFYRCGLEGLGLIVKTQDQAAFIVSDMLTLVDSGIAERETFGFVLASDLLPALNQLQDPVRVSQEIANAMVDLEPYFAMSLQERETYDNRFTQMVKQVEAAAGSPTYGEFGGCWLWLHDNTAPLTRALLGTTRAFVSRDGRYLAALYEFSDSRGLREREAMATRLAEMVAAEFGVPSCSFSVLNSGDPTEVPFYADVFDDDIGFFNCSWNARG